MRKLWQLWFLPGGRVSAPGFLLSGIVLFVAKAAMDAALMQAVAGVSWWPTDYWLPREGRIQPFDNRFAPAGILLIVAALPFIWVGVNLSLKRSASVGWPGVLACFFFVPYLNLVYFAALVLKGDAEPDAQIQQSPGSAKWLADPARLSFALAATCVGLVGFSALVLESYGWALFVGVPFFSGFIPSLLFNPGGYPTWRECLRVTFQTQLLMAIGLLFINIEGILCLLMASPVAILVGLIGTGLGHAFRRAAFWHARMEVGCVSILVLPVLMMGEVAARPEPTLFKVSSSVMIGAPREKVWRHVIAFPELPPPTEWMFKAGIAYPIRAEIDGHGVGAIRRCVFSTGPFVEPIETWNEPELLRFKVTSNPPPMRELSFKEFHAPHLSGFLESDAGQFELRAAGASKTELIGTTWYRHGLWPETYWRLWSDYIIHTIHLRVLKHIKTEAERI